LVHAFAGERKNVIEGFAFGIDEGEERWRGKVDAGNAAVGAGDGPARVAIVGKRDSFL
jgi:hypothetical protein